jgi:hypothetical protein
MAAALGLRLQVVDLKEAVISAARNGATVLVARMRVLLAEHSH